MFVSEFGVMFSCPRRAERPYGEVQEEGRPAITVRRLQEGTSNSAFGLEIMLFLGMLKKFFPMNLKFKNYDFGFDARRILTPYLPVQSCYIALHS